MNALPPLTRMVAGTVDMLVEPKRKQRSALTLPYSNHRFSAGTATKHDKFGDMGFDRGWVSRISSVEVLATNDASCNLQKREMTDFAGGRVVRCKPSTWTVDSGYTDTHKARKTPSEGVGEDEGRQGVAGSGLWPVEGG